MHLTIRTKILALICFIQVPLAAASLNPECLIISGTDHDEKKAITRDNPIMQNLEIRGKKCAVYGSWDEASKFLKTQTPGKYLIYQGTHGGIGGQAICNKEKESPEFIIDQITQLSLLGFHLGYVNMSCYSGDLLQKFLAMQTASPVSEKICIITDSYVGRTAISRTMMAAHALDAVKDSSSLNDVFKTMRGGMSSAASWSESGLDKKFAMDKMIDPNAIIERVNDISKSCIDPLLENFYTVSSMPSVDLTVKKDLSSFLDNLKNPDTLRKSDYDSEKFWRIVNNLPPGSEVKNCLVEASKDLNKSLFPDGTQSSSLELLKAFDLVGTSASCKEALLDSKSVRSINKDILGGGMVSKSMNVKKALAMILMNTLRATSEPGHRSRVSIMGMLNKYDSLKETVGFDVNQVEKNLEANKMKASGEKLSVKDLERMIYDIGTSEIDPLDAFQKGSLYRAPRDSKDQARRKACEEFKL